MQTPIPAHLLLANFAQRGFTLRAVAGRVSVTPASALTSTDRNAIYESRDELLAILSAKEPWNQKAAIKLLCEADALVGQFGLSGRRAEVFDAASMVTSAFASRDMETLRFAVVEFDLSIRRLAHTSHQRRPQQVEANNVRHEMILRGCGVSGDLAEAHGSQCVRDQME
jgi:hypothetical protein